MLVLSRKTEESVVVGEHGRFEPMLKVTVLEVNGERVSLGFEAGDDVPVHRWEVWERILTSGRPGGLVSSAGRSEASRLLSEKVHAGRMSQVPAAKGLESRSPHCRALQVPA